MNTAVTSTYIETVMKIFQLTKLKADGVTEKFYEPVRELLTRTHLNLLQNSRVEGKPTEADILNKI